MYADCVSAFLNDSLTIFSQKSRILPRRYELSLLFPSIHQNILGFLADFTCIRSSILPPNLLHLDSPFLCTFFHVRHPNSLRRTGFPEYCTNHAVFIRFYLSASECSFLLRRNVDWSCASADSAPSRKFKFLQARQDGTRW